MKIIILPTLLLVSASGFPDQRRVGLNNHIYPTFETLPIRPSRPFNYRPVYNRPIAPPIQPDRPFTYRPIYTEARPNNEEASNNEESNVNQTNTTPSTASDDSTDTTESIEISSTESFINEDIEMVTASENNIDYSTEVSAVDTTQDVTEVITFNTVVTEEDISEDTTEDTTYDTSEATTENYTDIIEDSLEEESDDTPLEGAISTIEDTTINTPEGSTAVTTNIDVKDTQENEVTEGVDVKNAEKLMLNTVTEIVTEHTDDETVTTGPAATNAAETFATDMPEDTTKKATNSDATTDYSDLDPLIEEIYNTENQDTTEDTVDREDVTDSIDIFDFSLEDFYAAIPKWPSVDLGPVVPELPAGWQQAFNTFFFDPSSPLIYALSYDYSSILVAIRDLLEFMVSPESPGAYIVNYDYGALFGAWRAFLTTGKYRNLLGDAISSVDSTLGFDLEEDVVAVVVIAVAAVAAVVLLLPLFALLSILALVAGLALLLTNDVFVAKLVEEFELSGLEGLAETTARGLGTFINLPAFSSLVGALEYLK